MTNAEQQAHRVSQLVAKATRDEEFRRRLLAAPAAVVGEYGVEIPAGVELRVLENTNEVVHLALPPLEKDGELSDAELEGVAGGLVVIAIIGVLIQTLLPAVQKVPPTSGGRS